MFKFSALWLAEEVSRRSVNQSEVEPEQIVTCFHLSVHKAFYLFICLFICGGVCERAVNTSNSGSGGRGFKQGTRKEDIELYSTSELSSRAGDRGFPPASLNITPGYFHRKIEPKEIPNCLIPRPLVVFTWQLEISYVSDNPATLSLFTQVCKWVPVTCCWGVTLRWISIPSSVRGSSNTPRHASS